MPKSVAPHAAKAFRSLAKPYDVLAEIFRAGDLQRLRAEINVGQSVWHIVSNFYAPQLSVWEYTF
jgi:COP9 signalosome complex subunit 3